MRNVTLKKTNPPVSESGSGKKCNSNSTDSQGALLAEIHKGITLKSREERDKSEEKRLKKQEAKKLCDNGNQQHPDDIATAINKQVNKIRKGMGFSDSENEHSSSSDNSGWTTDEDKDKQKEQKKKVRTKHKRKSTSSTLQSDNNKRSESSDSDHGSNNKVSQGAQVPSGSQSLHRKRRESPDSDYESDDNVKSKPTSPSYPVPKVEKPSLPPKPVNLKTKSEAPPASQVNEVQDPSTLPLKDRITKFGGEALQYQKQFVVQRSQVS